MELNKDQREALDLGWKLAGLAEEQASMVVGYRGTEAECMWQHVSHFFLVKSIHCFRAYLTLLAEGYGREGLVLLRSLVEALISLRYIAQQPKKRARRYLEYDYVARYRLLKAVRRLDDSEGGEVFRQVLEGRDEDEKELQAQYESVKSGYKVKTQWSDRSIRCMAKSVGMEWQYDLVYSQCCTHAHFAAGSIKHYMSVDAKGLLIDFAPSSESLKKGVWESAYYLAGIVAVNRDELSRNAPDEILDIVRRLSALVASSTQ